MVDLLYLLGHHIYSGHLMVLAEQCCDGQSHIARACHGYLEFLVFFHMRIVVFCAMHSLGMASPQARLLQS